MIKYGLISDCDARCLEKTIDLIFQGTNMINITEIGLYNCQTSKGLMEYCGKKYSRVTYTGIDNLKDKTADYIMENMSIYDNLIIGDADEMAYKLDDNSQDLIFADPCHCFAHTVSNFFSYASKVKTGGYFAFHDTGKHIQPFKDFQHGDEKNPDAYISARKALDKIGLLRYTVDMSDHEFVYGNKLPDRYNIVNGFQLIFDEADETNPAGGICCFRRL